MSKLKYYDGTNWNVVNGQITGDTLPIGTQVPYGSTTPPANWLVCDGSYVSKTTYSELYAVIGDSYLDGETAPEGTFRLPNKKGRSSVGYDNSDTDFNAIGKKGGSKELQQHRHEVGTRTGATGSGGYGALYQTNSTATEKLFTSYEGTGNSGNLSPYEVDCWIIKAKQSAGLIANVSKIYSTSENDTYACSYVNGIIESGSNTNGYYTKFVDGTLICTGTSGQITTNKGAGSYEDQTTPYTFASTDYYAFATLNDGQSYWGNITITTKVLTVSSFRISTWNTSTAGNNSNQTYKWIAIGKWK